MEKTELNDFLKLQHVTKKINNTVNVYLRPSIVYDDLYSVVVIGWIWYKQTFIKTTCSSSNTTRYLYVMSDEEICYLSTFLSG